MADYSGVISLSQPHISDDDDSFDHLQRRHPGSVPTSAVGGGGSNTETPTPSPTSKNSTGKPRGRPPGSKNKPKPPATVIVTKNDDSSMKALILEISAGSDIIEAIITFAREKKVGVTVITASGSVSKVTLRHPNIHSPPISLHGPFGMLSLSGSYIDKISEPSSTTSSSSSSSFPSPLACSFGVTLSGAQGHVFGGIVGGKVVAATQVVVMAATFVRPSVHRLPCKVDDNIEYRLRQESRPAGVLGNVINGGGPAGSVAVGAGGGAFTEPPKSNSTGHRMPPMSAVYGIPSSIPVNYHQISPDIVNRVTPWGTSARPY